MAQTKTARRIRYFAYKARRKAEAIAKKEKFPDNLESFCARGSAILHAELTKAGYKPRIYFYPGHVYVHCEGYYVDITATQFSDKIGRTVVRKESTIGQLNEISRRWGIDWAEWNVDSPIDVRRLQDEMGWHLQKGKVKRSDWKDAQLEFFLTAELEVKKKEIEKEKKIKRKRMIMYYAVCIALGSILPSVFLYWIFQGM